MTGRSSRSAWQRWRKCMPILSWLPKYCVQRDLKSDVIAAFTVCVMLVPQEMSLAALMGVPAQYGLYSAAIAPLVYPIFGSSRAASVANTSEAGLLVAVMLRSTRIQSLEERIATGILLTFFSGIIMIVSGFMHQGGLVTFFSRTAMNAYVTAMAFLTVTSQVPAWLGITLSSVQLSAFTYIEIFTKIPHVNLYSFTLGVFSAALLILFKLIKRKLSLSAADANNLARQTAQVHISEQSVSLCDATHEAEHVTVEALVQSTAGICDEKGGSIESPNALGRSSENFSSSNSYPNTHNASPTKPPYSKVYDYPPQRRVSNGDRVQLLERGTNSTSASNAVVLGNRMLSKHARAVLLSMCDAGSLLVCIMGMIVGYYLGEDKLRLTGEVHRGLPSTLFPLSAFGDTVPVDRAQEILSNACMVSVVAFMSSVAMGSNLANKQGYHISANQELLGLGFANLVSSFFQGMPSSMGMSRSVVNAESAHSPLASMITAALVMLTLLFLTAPLFYLPLAPLAALIITSSLGLIDFSEPKWLFRVRRREFYVWVTAFVSTVSLGLLRGLLISVGASLLEIMGRTKKPRVETLGETADGQWLLMAEPPVDVLAVRVEQSLYFGNANHLVHAIDRRLESARERGCVVGIIIDGARINDVDASSIHTLREYEVKLQRGAQQHILTFANLRPETAQELMACGFSGWAADESESESDSRLEKAGGPKFHDFTNDVASAAAFLRSEMSTW